MRLRLLQLDPAGLQPVVLYGGVQGISPQVGAVHLLRWQAVQAPPPHPFLVIHHGLLQGLSPGHLSHHAGDGYGRRAPKVRT